ncbi:hypothetical protein BDW02DRAFT_626865 [Decorospora gaudefroyi]|uniref:Uncharacterized protein n=1 Tax=Decorospora gaudefroyi TaxID=184978 RepID=A0A6A5KRM7_9PLEO|nr:hypothetical protein BDW02DRAFT_626865 [Decorospora gaudefroyi]
MLRHTTALATRRTLLAKAKAGAKIRAPPTPHHNTPDEAEFDMMTYSTMNPGALRPLPVPIRASDAQPNVNETDEVKNTTTICILTTTTTMAYSPINADASRFFTFPTCSKPRAHADENAISSSPSPSPKPWPYSLPVFLRPVRGTTFAGGKVEGGGKRVAVLQAVLVEVKADVTMDVEEEFGMVAK